MMMMMKFLSALEITQVTSIILQRSCTNVSGR